MLYTALENFKPTSLAVKQINMYIEHNIIPILNWCLLGESDNMMNSHIKVTIEKKDI